MFTSFSLQAENNTDAVYVYDGENATGEVLGVFYGGHPPPKDGIYSSSNHMFVIFKSDRNGSYAGFQASYHTLNCSRKFFSLFALPRFLTRNFLLRDRVSVYGLNNKNLGTRKIKLSVISLYVHTASAKYTH